MPLELKLRKVCNSLGIILPKEALARLNAKEGDTIVFTHSENDGYRITPGKSDFAHQMAIAEDIARRYHNTLRELAK